MALPPILVELKASSADFMAKMAEARMEIGRLGTESSGHFDKLASVGKAAFLGMAGGAIAVGAAGVKMAADFQEGMTTLVTGAGESEKNIRRVSQGILDLAGSTGTSTKQLIDGMYMIESAGYHGSAGLQVLKAAAQGAKVGSADLGTTANALTSALHAYGKSGADAVPVMNTLIATTASGKMHMQDLADSIGTVIPAAAAVHVNLQQVGAAMASMTSSGTPAAQAATYLRQVLVSFSAPTKASAHALESVGLTAGQLSQTLSKQGLLQAMQLLSAHMHEHLTPGTQEWTNALVNIAGGKKQMMAVLELMPHLSEFGNNLATITDKANGSKTAVDGWKLVQQDFNQQLAEAKGHLEHLGITLGTVLLPYVEKAVKDVSDLVGWFQRHQTEAKVLAGLVGGALAIAIGTYFVHALQSASEALTLTGRAAQLFGAQAAEGEAAAELPLLPWILAVAAVGVAAYELYKHWDQVWGFIKHITAEGWSALKNAFIDGVKGIVDLFLGMAVTVTSLAAKAFGWVPGIGGHLKDAAAAVAAFRDSTNTALDGLKDHTINVTIAQSVIATQAAKNAAATIGKNAMGTDFWRGGATWVGERGPEIVNLPRGSQVIPNHKLGSLGGNVHVDAPKIHVEVHGNLDNVTLSQVHETIASNFAHLARELQAGRR